MKRRLKRFLKWAAIAAGLFLAGFLLWSAACTWITGRRLEARLVAIREAGEPLSLADFATATISPEANADVVLEAAAADVEAAEKDLTALYPKAGRPTWPLKPGEEAGLEGVFRSRPGVVPTLLEAADRPDYAHAFDETSTTALLTEALVRRSGRHRAAIRVLESWSMLRLARGAPDEALAAAVAALRLSRYWGRDPGLIGSLTSIACSSASAASAARVLQAGPVGEEGRRDLDAELDRYERDDLLRRGLRSERAYALTSVAEMSGSIFWLKGWMRNGLSLLLLDVYEDELKRPEFPPRRAGSPAVASPVDSSRHPLKMLAQLLLPAVQSFRDAHARQRAAVRSLRILNALQARPPADPAAPKLDSLGLPPEATLDPFLAGKPLNVKRASDGWLVYSVGRDLADDGGDLEKDRDVGFGPPREAPEGRP